MLGDTNGRKERYNTDQKMNIVRWTFAYTKAGCYLTVSTMIKQSPEQSIESKQCNEKVFKHI